MNEIKVEYKIVPKQGERIADILGLLKKDISWGTFIPRLKSAENSLKKAPVIPDYSPDRFEPTVDPKDNNIVELSFNTEMFDFEREGINHFIGTIAGDILFNNKIEEIRINKISFTPNLYDTYFKGPKSGTNVLRENILQSTLNNTNRPIVAFTVKPRLGLNIAQYERIISDAAKAEIDIIEDDERLVDPRYCPFKQRVDAIHKLIQNGSKSKFSVNLTGNPDLLRENVEYAYQKGIRIFKLDVMVAGFDMLKKLNDIRFGFDEPTAITVFPDVYESSYRHLSRSAILELARLCGADIIYAGSSKYSRMGVIDNPEDLETDVLRLISIHHELSKNINNTIKPTLPTMTHDIHPSSAESLIYAMRYYKHYDYAFFIGGGIAGFDDAEKDIYDTGKFWMELVKRASSKDISGLNNFGDIGNIIEN